ncbi:Phosphotransferase enzyme [Epicoccum nigrum]|nr:Phosphotransferase enzyme [Epicoccum nigrum]
MEQGSELFEYTSGRWMLVDHFSTKLTFVTDYRQSWNDAFKYSERRRLFNISELKHLAASAVGRSPGDVARFEKLGEEGFNRSFLITMCDGFQLVGRIPYTTTEPKQLVIASEVATMDFLRMHGIPVPKIYRTNLGDIWLDLPEKARITVVTRLVELESRLFALPFSASGSLYCTKDLDIGIRKAGVTTTNTSASGSFCIGPDTRLGLWYGKRSRLNLDRGPYPAAVLAAGAKKEIAYLTKYGQPLHPFQPLRRELYNYQKVSPSEHVHSLDKYLQAVPYIIPNGESTITRPTLKHPDLQPNNVFVSDDLSIAGLIDWQHCALLPLFLQCGIPNSLQNYGDSTSESLIPPELPQDFDEMNEHEQFKQVLLLRRRQLHYFYVAATAKLNPIHYGALTRDFSTLRRKLFDHASSPWEGDNITLKTDLIELAQNWSDVIKSNSNTGNEAGPLCPVRFSEEDIKHSLDLNAAQLEADEQIQACGDAIGIGPEGWVPLDQYDESSVKVSSRRTRLRQLSPISNA